MKLGSLLTLITATFLTFQNAQSQSIFRKSYTGLNELASVETLPGGGYVFCGTDAQATGATNMSLMKTDQSGTIQWSKTYGSGNLVETGRKVIRTLEGGYLMIGSATSNYVYPFVVKTNADGNVIWANYYQSLSSVNPSQYINDVVPMADSGYVFAGSSANNYSFLMRVDKNGNIVWSNCHLTGTTILNRIIPISGGEFLATGSRSNVFYVARLSATGNVVAARTYTTMGTTGWDIFPTADGNFVFCGATASATTLMKTDLAGNVYWAKSYNTTLPWFPSVRELTSGSFIVSMYANSYGPMILTVDNIGNTPVVRYFGSGSNNYADKMKSTADGGFVNVNGTQFMKFTSTSNFTCTANVVALTATGIAPIATVQTATYNTVGLIVAPVYYISSIPVTLATSCGGKCLTSDNLSSGFNAPDTVCMGQSVTFSFAGSGTVSTYDWSENGITFSTTSSPAKFFNVAGAQNIRLIITNSAGCKDTSIKTVYVRSNCGTTGAPMNYFTKTFTNYNTSVDVQPTSDNGFILAGSTTLPGTPDMCIIKTDSAGVIAWGRSYGSGSLSEYATKVRQMPDGGYLLVGDENYVFAVRVGPTGNFVWENNYQLISGASSTTSQVVQDMIITPDSGAIIVGSASTNYSMLFKIDKNGAVVWANHSLGTGLTTFTGITATGTGNYMIVGTHGAVPVMLEINGSGVIQWSRQFTQLTGISKLLRLTSGNYVLVGSNSTTRMALVKVTPAGDVIWAKYSNTIGAQTGLSAREDIDNGFIISMYGASYGTVIMKYDDFGNNVDTRYYTGTSPTSSLIKTASGAYALTDGSLLRKFTAYNMISSCTPNPIAYQTTAFNPVPTTVNLTPNTYAVTNNQFYIPTITSHVLATPCSNTGCNTIAQFVTNPTACTNDLVTFTNTSLGGVTYTWNENGVPFASTFNTTRTFSAPGTYVMRLDVFGPNGCNNSFTVNVVVSNGPIADAGNNVSITCGGSTNLLATGGGTYSWSPATGLSNPNIANPVATPATTTTYTVTVSNGSCSSTDTVTVTVTGGPTVGVSGTNNICPGGSTLLTATGATTYVWNPGNMTGTSVTVSPTVTTTYTVTGTTGSCSGTQTYLVTVNPSPTVTVSSNASICTGSSANLTAGGASTYNWNPGNLSGSNVSVSPTTTTTYTVTGTDANGCTDTNTVTITVNPLPTVTYNETNTLVCLNWPVFTLTPGSPLGGTYSGPGVSGNQFTAATAGAGTWNIVYSFTDGNGCTNTATSQITVDLCTGTSTSLSMTNIVVYPNPFKEVITLSGMEGNTKLEMFNVLGELVISTEITTPHFELRTSTLPSGVYYLKTTSEPGGISIIKVVKQY